jgi:hypothetical protein
MLTTHLLLLAAAPLAQAFAPATYFGHHVSSSLSAVSYDDIADIGYEVEVSKPLGIIFGENPDPYNGLVVDDVEAGLNGGSAGLRVGDQLVSINGRTVVGGGFDDIMGQLRDAPGDLELQLYRGNVRSLYVILTNRVGDNPAEQEGGDGEQDEDSEEVIMDEDYESPVVIDISQYEVNEEPLNVGDFFNGLKKVGAMLTEKKEDPAPAAAADTSVPKEETKKSGGIFGMFKQESIQLDGDEASGTALK